MVLAAGRGERMRPLSDHTPKPLIEIAGRSMLDRMLDRLEDCEKVVVNAWHLADRIEEAVAHRTKPLVVVSREIDLLDTGGGVAAALSHLAPEPFVVAAGDVVVTEGAHPALEILARAWDGSAMDALLLLVPLERAGGFRGAGDFFRDGNGRLQRRGGADRAPYVYGSMQIVHPRLFDNAPAGAFSFNRLWDRAIGDGRLFGAIHEGGWFTIDRPENITAAEAWLEEQP